MVDKRQLLGMTLEELKGVASEVGLPAYAAKQMADWIYKKKNNPDFGDDKYSGSQTCFIRGFIRDRGLSAI